MGPCGNRSLRKKEKGLNEGNYRWHHAPPPGSRSGVADYAETLGRELTAFGTPAVHLYHLGNNALHSEIYRKALQEPGVIVLHDAVLHHFLLGHLTRDLYIEEFAYNYGEWRRSLAESLWDERGSSGVDPRYFEFPLLKRIIERSRAVIVHNPGAARMAQAHAPGHISIHVIPHFFEPAALPVAAETARFRQRIGVGQGTTLFGIFGYLRETKRILPCLAAFRRLHAVTPTLRSCSPEPPRRATCSACWTPKPFTRQSTVWAT